MFITTTTTGILVKKVKNLLIFKELIKAVFPFSLLNKNIKILRNSSKLKNTPVALIFEKRVWKIVLCKMKNQVVKRIMDNSFGGYYREELINLRSIDRDLPEPLKIARDFARSYDGKNLSRAHLFFKQAQMLADYEDDFDYDKNVIRYYPTYQSLNNNELRAYFSWRTKWRKGIKKETSLSFAFIYVYELIHLVGCADAKESYSKLTAFVKDYFIFDSYIEVYMKDWLIDFVVYYGLDPILLEDTEKIQKDKAISILLNIHENKDEDIFQSVSELSGTTLTNSRLTKKYPEMMKAVVVGTLRRVASHYAEKCQNSWIDRYFGYFWKKRVWFFQKAIFFYRKPTENCEIELSTSRKYSCVDGIWYLNEFQFVPEYRKRFLDLLRTIDSMIRKFLNFPHQIQQKITTKWIVKTIEEEIQKWNEVKQRKESRKREIHFDLSKLGDIRSDSVETREKLLTEEEIQDNSAVQTETESDILNSANSECDPSNDNVGFDSLSSQEKRYLQCLLNGISINWISNEGLLPSLLCDSINDKLFCLFEDTVLENGEIIEDYTEELKKGLCS